MAAPTYRLETEIRDAEGKLLVRPTTDERRSFGNYCLQYRMHYLCDAAQQSLDLPGSSVPYRVVFTVRLVEINTEHDRDGLWLSETTLRELTCDRWVR